MCRRVTSDSLVQSEPSKVTMVLYLSKECLYASRAVKEFPHISDEGRSEANSTFNFSETAFRCMDEKPEMFKSRSIDCIYCARTWNSVEFGKCCDKLEEQALVLMVDNGLSTLQYQRILEQAENLNCKLYPSYHKVKEAKQLRCPHSISMTNINRNNFADTR
ncbi:hypothetical protein AVEN_163415-1 [Araneus ventricosus]|uniref:Uncharacterized protein n=1 Tax=Araneus ventricosus TaxID=182803 RepID=A0A4Y2W132_ARAVE|nr:hypothetical protein AVEN_163415-1 [Araneus ventricosus]